MYNKQFLEINDCKHYFVNEGYTDKMCMTDSEFFVEIDTETKHPMGDVFKPANCIDTAIRLVRHIDKKVFMFNILDWNKTTNPFSKNYQKKSLLNLINLI